MKNLPYSPLPRRNHFKSKMFWTFLCALLYVGQAHAQVCQLPEGVECTLNEPSAFKIITTSKTFSQMIADGELLPQATSGNTPQFLVVCQTITHDLFGMYVFGAGSEIVFLNNSSGIVINGNNNNYLRFQSTYLHGCQKLWNGIQVKGGLVEFRPFCRVEDALTAVQLEPNSRLISETCTFDGNYTSIFAGGPGTPNQHSITINNFNGNTFSGQKPLIENYVPNPQTPSCFYSKPMYGIVAQNVQHLNMVAWGGHTNHFRDFSASWSCSVFNPAAPTGIFAQNSSLTVSDVAFRNIANGSGGKGVNFVVTPGAASTLDLTGRGKNGFFTFENVQTGVYGLGNMTIRASHFNNLERGIYMTGNPAPYTVTITGNSFANVDDHTVFADQISPINRFVVQGNDFNDNDPYSGGINGFPRSGVHIRSFTPGHQSSWIFNNTFLNSPKAGMFTFGNRGVWIRNLNGSLIEQNQFTDNFGSTAQPYEGVSVFNASTSIWSNNFAGAGNWGVHPSAATQVQESPSCWLNCNYADQTKLGWEFQGVNSDAAKLEKNIANAHDKGLLMRTDAVIGNQNNKYNRWIGNVSNTEAQFEGRDLGNAQDVFFVQQSRFRIHTPNMATDFWPDPRLFGNVADPGQWFIPGSAAIVECIATVPPDGGGETLAPLTTEADARVMDGTYQPVKGYAAGLWEAKLRLYGRLSEHPELRPSGSVEAIWYAAQQNTTVGSLCNLYQGILSLSRYSALEQVDLDNAATAQQSATQAVTDKDAQIAVNLDNPAVLEQLFTERQQLEVTLAAAIAAHENLLGSLRNAKLSAAQQQLGQASAISTTEPYETDFKTVCCILLETFTDENGVSESNQQVLSAIAHQCRYEGGFAVLQARASLGDEWNWGQYDNCPDAGERSSKVTPTIAMSLYPNPAKDAALLDMGYTVTTGRATLRDLSGRALQEWALDGHQQIWLRWNGQLPAGLYLLEVAADQPAPRMLKLAIYKN
jgi:hypothetical protein